MTKLQKNPFLLSQPPELKLAIFSLQAVGVAASETGYLELAIVEKKSIRLVQ